MNKLWNFYSHTMMESKVMAGETFEILCAHIPFFCFLQAQSQLLWLNVSVKYIKDLVTHLLSKFFIGAEFWLTEDIFSSGYTVESIHRKDWTNGYSGFFFGCHNVYTCICINMYNYLKIVVNLFHGKLISKKVTRLLRLFTVLPIIILQTQEPQ